MGCGHEFGGDIPSFLRGQQANSLMLRPFRATARSTDRVCLWTSAGRNPPQVPFSKEKHKLPWLHVGGRVIFSNPGREHVVFGVQCAPIVCFDDCWREASPTVCDQNMGAEKWRSSIWFPLSETVLKKGSLNKNTPIAA